LSKNALKLLPGQRQAVGNRFDAGLPAKPPLQAEIEAVTDRQRSLSTRSARISDCGDFTLSALAHVIESAAAASCASRALALRSSLRRVGLRFGELRLQQAHVIRGIAFGCGLLRR